MIFFLFLFLMNYVRVSSMYTHEEIWIAIDRLAKASGHSTSGLAIKAGLDPTSFNKSKRFQPNKKPRWPSMESISKILSATQTTMDEFIALIQNPAGLVAHKLMIIRTARFTVLAIFLSLPRMQSSKQKIAPCLSCAQVK